MKAIPVLSLLIAVGCGSRPELASSGAHVWTVSDRTLRRVAEDQHLPPLGSVGGSPRLVGAISAEHVYGATGLVCVRVDDELRCADDRPVSDDSDVLDFDRQVFGVATAASCGASVCVTGHLSTCVSVIEAPTSGTGLCEDTEWYAGSAISCEAAAGRDIVCRLGESCASDSIVGPSPQSRSVVVGASTVCAFDRSSGIVDCYAFRDPRHAPVVEYQCGEHDLAPGRTCVGPDPCDRQLIRIATLHNVAAIAASYAHLCVAHTNDELRCWSW
jgi:hypothetical protein